MTSAVPLLVYSRLPIYETPRPKRRQTTRSILVSIEFEIGRENVSCVTSYCT